MSLFRLIHFCVFIKFVTSGLPSLFPVCLRNDPELSKCVLRSIEVLKPRLPSGDLGQGFKLPPIEPFYIPKIQYGSTSGIRVTLTNAYLSGLSRFNVEALSVSINNEVKIDMILSFPRQDIKGRYQIIFALLGAPLYSEGRLSATYTNVKVRVMLKGRRYLRNGVEYIRFDPLYFKFLNYNVQDVQFTNLFDGSLFFGRLLYSYIVYNKEYITAMINPDLEKTFSQIFTKISNQIADQASFDELFPR